MGRPKKKGLDRFPLPVDFFAGPIMGALRGEFGVKGEIALLKIVCSTFRYGYYLKWNTQTRMCLLAELPGITAELLQQIVQRLAKWGYFDVRMFHQHKVLTNEWIQEVYLSLTRRRQSPRRLPYMLNIELPGRIIAYNNGVSADNNPVIADKKEVIAYNNGVSAYNNPVIANKNPTTAGVLSPSPPITPSTYKEKKITPKGVIKKKKGREAAAPNGKEKSCAKKEKQFTPPTLQQVEEYCRQVGMSGDFARRYHSYYAAVDWTTGTGIPITDWKAKMDEWMVKEEMKNGKEKTETCNPVRSAVAAGNNGHQGQKGVPAWVGSDI